MMTSPLLITDVTFRDAHQSLLATRMRLEDMLPIAAQMDEIGFWSVESWGGATFDACIRYLGEDPWERIRTLKKAMPNTRQQMLLRGQNLLGYRPYADDVVEKFVERAFENGVEVFRIFDAMNDIRNLQTAIKATIDVGAHAQGTISYTVSPAHTLEKWLDMARHLEDLECHSICIKDMAGLLNPFMAEQLIKQLKQSIEIPICLHCHATTGLSTASYLKAVEADIDMLDTSISSMSMTYGHTATETMVSILHDHDRDTGLDLNKLQAIASYFRKIRSKYVQFEGSLKGIDSRILVAQVPGGMLTNMEKQLKEQQAIDKFDEVLEEIPKVREDLGFIPLVTPTSQIVGTQAVLNVLTGERYKTITQETEGILKGEYGATSAPVNAQLQQRVLKGAQPVTCRPADLLEPEWGKLQLELTHLAKEKNLVLATNIDDDTLTYALFPQVGIKFLQNRGNPEAFEVKPLENVIKPSVVEKEKQKVIHDASEAYNVQVNGTSYHVVVSPGGEIKQLEKVKPDDFHQSLTMSGCETLNAPLSGNINKIKVKEGDLIKHDEIVIIMEAMKMETAIRACKTGKVSKVHVNEGDVVSVGEPLLLLE